MLASNVAQNILVDEQNKLKICDFGLSQVREALTDVKNANIIGTPQWCAPELLRSASSPSACLRHSQRQIERVSGTVICSFLCSLVFFFFY